MGRLPLRALPILMVALVARGAWPLGTQAATQGAAPANTWVNVTGNLAKMASECGNLTLLSPVPRSDRIIAGVAGKGLWANSRGSSWSQLGSGAESEAVANRASWITYDPIRPHVFWESGSYGNGVYKTTDGGRTFRQLGSIRHVDYVSVDFRDPSRATLLAGGHEQSQLVYRSTDGGETWTNIGLKLPAKTGASTNPLVINARTYLVNTVGSGIFRTTNAGFSWQQVSALGPSGPPLVASDGTIYWPVNSSLARSSDSGLTWTQVGSNLQPVHPIELADGKLVSVGANNLMISDDGGSNWSPFGAPLPFTPAGVIYSPSRRTFFIWHWDCGAVVLPDAVAAIS